MKKWFLTLMVLVLILSMLTGCAASSSYIPYHDMTYSRPNMTDVQQSLADACEIAKSDDTESIMDAVYTFYDAYDWFYTCYALADIRYCGDLEDIYWSQEYAYCTENCTQVDAALDELYYALAQSPARKDLETAYFGEGFFDGYEGESPWTEEFTALMEAEAVLQNQYYTLSEEAMEYEADSPEYYDACAEEMAGLLVELIEVRQDIAAYCGYDNYPQFASDYYHYRDYTADQSVALFADIRQELVPLYRRYADSPLWENYYTACTEQQTLGYAKQTAKNMGGLVAEAWELLEKAGLYDISYGENKLNTAFEIYLYSYWEPFIFMCPTLSAYDQLSFIHEFGHFCTDYACYGSYAGVDVLEFFSQGMEYLSLCYNTDAENLAQIKMLDSLCIYVEQAAFADFEQQMYSLSDEELTVNGLYALYNEVASSYGFDVWGYDPREFVSITHFYTDPMYIISYVVSNDAAMQLYQLEQTQPGAGLTLYEENLTSQESYFLTFLQTVGLESPFSQGRIQQVRETFEAILG